MSYNIYLINKRKKEFVRTKSNGEQSEFLIDYLNDNIGEEILIEGQDSLSVENLLYEETGLEYKEIELTDYSD